MAQQNRIDFTPLDNNENTTIDFEPIDFEPINEPINDPNNESNEPSQLKKIANRFLYGFSEEEMGGRKLAGPPTEDDFSIFPRMGENQETYWGGFGRSLYNDFISPLGTVSGIIGSSSPGRFLRPIPPGKQKLLPAGRGPGLETDPFIGGPSGGTGIVERKSFLDPKTETYIGTGQSTSGRSGSISGTNVDLEALRESERLKNIFYTQNEQLGGSRMSIPDRAIIDSPPISGERGLGFEPVSRANLEYPLNVVPEKVRPRSVQETTRALAGDDMASSPARPINKNIIFENEPAPVVPKIEKSINPTSALRPGEPTLPSAIKTTIREARQNAKINIDEQKILNAPDIVKEPLIKLAAEEAKLPSPWSIRGQLRKMAPALARLDERAVQLTRQYDAQWVPAFENAIRKLSKTEKQNFGNYVEGATPITSPNVQKAVDIWRAAESQIGDEATRIGLRLFTDSKKWIPFQKNTDKYWPHIPTEKLADKDLITNLMDSGMSRAQANRVVNHYRKTGELIIGSQRARVLGSKVPYRKDADVAITHIRSMSKRMAQHREFGPMDVNGRGAEGIADLIESSSRPKYTLELMNRLVGRDDVTNPALVKALDYSRRWAAITKLKNFTLPNIYLGSITTGVRAANYPVASIKEVSKLFSKRYRNELAKSGVWQNFSHTLAEEMAHFDPYLIGVGETFNRGIAGAVGKGVAKAAHQELRKNPASKLARRELNELILENVDDLLKQDELTNAQLNMAAGRMAEMTQGLNVPGNLPKWGSNPVKDIDSFAMQLGWQFKKMGYQATAEIWKSIKANPKIAIPAWLTLTQVAGELTADTKAIMRGMWSGNIEEELNTRTDNWLDEAGISDSMINEVAAISGVEPEIIARILDNWTQAFLLGLPADMMMSGSYGPQALANTLVGPVVSDVGKFVNQVMTGNFSGMGKEAIKNAPLPGASGLADYVYED